MGKIKDKLYYYFAEKNWGVRREYGPYVDAHREEHKNHRLKHWLLLIKLNWHYRVLRKTELYITNGEMETVSNNNQRSEKNHIPCINVSESSLSRRQEEIFFTRKLLQYDVVSFDIFDTLILRPFSSPDDLFILMGQKLEQFDFPKIRKEADKIARERSKEKTGKSEISIFEIYDVVEEMTGIPKEKGVQVELETELKYCFANPYMQRVYQLLLEHNKKIIIVSDMFMPKEMLAQLLEKNGYDVYEKLYVSCDYYSTKRSGALYDIVMKDYPNASIIHIGDNENSDIKSAERKGIETAHYRAVNMIGRNYRADGMSALTGSAYRGIINSHLHNGPQIYSPQYEYGFIYGGIYVLGYCNWIHRKAKAENVDKVLFLARDGAIYQKVFNLLFDDMPNEYFYWSRMGATKYAFEKNRYFFIKRNIETRINVVPQTSISSLLKSLYLTELEKYLPDYKLNKDDLLTQETFIGTKALFLDHWDEAKNIYENSKHYMLSYIEKKIGDSKKVAFVDAGWTGASTMCLKHLIKNELQLPCEVTIWMAGAKNSGNIPNIMDEEIDAYLFSPIHNTNSLKIHNEMRVGDHFFELFTQDITPSFNGFDNEGNMLFALPETENHFVVNEIHKGIFDFCKLYKAHFTDEPVMFNISGVDAYQPFRFLGKHPAYFKKHFSDVLIARSIGCTEEEVEVQRAKNDLGISKFLN